MNDERLHVLENIDVVHVHTLGGKCSFFLRPKRNRYILKLLSWSPLSLSDRIFRMNTGKQMLASVKCHPLGLFADQQLNCEEEMYGIAR